MNTPLTCDANGNWQRGTTCTNICTAGSCVGVCTPGAKTCVGNIPQLCDGQGQWQAAPACMFVCRQGDCGGVCKPGARQCSSSGMPQSCNADGAWDTGQACPFVCSQGVCSGLCKPGQVNCSNNVPQTCTAAGDWQSGTACQYVCTNGACAGSCTPGAHQCANNVPQTCTANGAWQSGTACQYLCSAGVCGGSCVPSSTRCNNGQKQICDAQGGWQDTTTPSMQVLANPGFDAGSVAWMETTLSSSTIITPRQRADFAEGPVAVEPRLAGRLLERAGRPVPGGRDPRGRHVDHAELLLRDRDAGELAGILDTMDVYVYDPGTAKYTSVAAFNDNMATPTWTRFVATLPLSLAGKTVQVGFKAATDGTKNTNFFIDTVALDVVACTATP